MGLLTSLFIWIYIQRVNLDYNSEGLCFSPEESVVYHEQAKVVYGFLALLGLVLTRIIIKRKPQNANRT